MPLEERMAAAISVSTAEAAAWACSVDAIWVPSMVSLLQACSAAFGVAGTPLSLSLSLTLSLSLSLCVCVCVCVCCVSFFFPF